MKYKIKYLNLHEQHKAVYQSFDKELKKIFVNSSFVLREHVKKFENEIAKKLKAKYVVGLNSGTDALLMGLCAANIKKGDEIIVPSHTYVATISAIVHVGAKPIFVDIDEDFNINPDLIQKKITRKTKAIVPVHLNGHSCNMKEIVKIAKKNKLKIVEDAAQSFGSKQNNIYSGTFGECGAFSLHPMKNLNVPGDGGFLVTNKKKVYDMVSLLRDHGRARANKSFGIKKQHLKCFGFNSRLDNIHAAIALIKLKKFDRWIQQRRKVAQYYHKNLKNIKSIKLPIFEFKNKKYFDTYNSYVIRVKKRNLLKKYFKRFGVEVFSHMDRGIHLEKKLITKKWYLPKTEKIESEIISLPIYSEMKKSSQDYIIKIIKKFYLNKS